MDLRGDVDGSPLERAGDAVSRGDWDGAFTILRSLQEERDLAPDELDQLAQAAYGAGDPEAALTAWEQVHAAHNAAGDHVAAAAAAATIAMYLMMDTGLMAPVRGWASRAERLLDGHDECPVHAVLAMVRTYERLMCGDMHGAGDWARRAIDVGTRHHAPAAVAVARVAQARLLIFEGQIDEGLALLDDAAVATVSGELDPLAVGMVYCELICAMQGLAQYDRAEEWTDAMDRWRHGNAFGGINGRCRVHRAEMLRLRGSCEEAEEEALHACEELRPWMRREFGWPLTELGTIRLRKGDLAGAEEAFLSAHESGWDPQPGLALLRLAQGDVAEASALIDEALERPVNLPWKERPPHGRLQRAPLLEAQVEIAVAAADLGTGRAAAAELTETAEAFRSRALAASAALARGRVALADGQPGAAIQESAAAVGGWSELAAPYETSMARMVLAQAQLAVGNEQAALMELRAAQSALGRIGARRKAEDAARACGDAAESAPVTREQTSHTPSSVFRLEGDTRRVTFDHTTILLRDLKGMRYLARLLREPGREFHVLDIVAVEAGASPLPPPGAADGLPVSPAGDAGPALDAMAKQAYRRRLREIEDDIDEATELGDSERATLAAADKEYLVRELSRAFGLGDRPRQIGSTSERARASVTRALRYALARIAEHHAPLSDHLQRSVTTGTYCRYAPDPRLPITWDA